MRRLFLYILLLASFQGYSQLKGYTIGPRGDTLNAMDQQGRKQGKWVTHIDEVRGEPGYEEEGEYRNNRKEGGWRIYTLSGDLAGMEFYRWGNKNGICQYFSNGNLVREESWRALNPDKQYDTLQIEDIDHINVYKTVIVKNEGVAIKDGVWKYYDTETGMIKRIQTFTLGKLETPKASTAPVTADADEKKAVAKPKEVLDFEKKTGKKKVKVQNGSVY